MKQITLAVFLALLLTVMTFAAGDKRAVLVIPHENFQDTEYLAPRVALEEAGITVKVASSSTSDAAGMNGSMIVPDLLVKDIDLNDFDAVVFIGGIGATEYFTDPAALKLAKQARQKNKVLGAICIAPEILSRAGVLKGVKATSSMFSRQNLKKNGAKFTGNPVEVSGRIITANGPGASQLFGQSIVKAIVE